MHGISDDDLAITAYKLGLKYGREGLLEELAALVGRADSTTAQELNSNAHRMLRRITALRLSGPAHDALTAKGVVFVCQLTAMTEKEFTRDFTYVGSSAKLQEFKGALQRLGLDFKAEG